MCAKLVFCVNSACVLLCAVLCVSLITHLGGVFTSHITRRLSPSLGFELKGTTVVPVHNIVQSSGTRDISGSEPVVILSTQALRTSNRTKLIWFCSELRPPHALQLAKLQGTGDSVSARYLHALQLITHILHTAASAAMCKRSRIQNKNLWLHARRILSTELCNPRRVGACHQCWNVPATHNYKQKHVAPLHSSRRTQPRCCIWARNPKHA